MTTHETAPSGNEPGALPFDTTKAHQARGYDYLLGALSSLRGVLPGQNTFIVLRATGRVNGFGIFWSTAQPCDLRKQPEYQLLPLSSHAKTPVDLPKLDQPGSVPLRRGLGEAVSHDRANGHAQTD
jgi:hypothetical protein